MYDSRPIVLLESLINLTGIQRSLQQGHGEHAASTKTAESLFYLLIDLRQAARLGASKLIVGRLCACIIQKCCCYLLLIAHVAKLVKC